MVWLMVTIIRFSRFVFKIAGLFSNIVAVSINRHAPVRRAPHPQTGIQRVMTPSPVIALIRHGDYQQPLNVPSALLPYALTPRGEEQALECARLLQDFATREHLSFHPLIDCSRQLRAYQTSRAIIAGLKLPGLVVREYEALAERSVGALANLDLQQIEAIVDNDPRYGALPQGWKANSDYCLPYQGAESLRQAGDRVARHLESVWQTMAARQLKLVVGHGAAIRHAVARLGIIHEADILTLSMYHARPVYIQQDEAGSWQRLAGEWKIRQLAGDEFGE
jgi:broad specificity phosphatase PhoE